MLGLSASLFVYLFFRNTKLINAATSEGTGVWQRHQNSMYMFMIDVSRAVDNTRQNADFYCKSNGGSLISISSKEELAYIHGRIQELVEGQGQLFSFEQWWTSGYFEEDEWKWANSGNGEYLPTIESQSPHTKNSLAPYLALVYNKGMKGWHFDVCPGIYRLRYICERDAKPELLLVRPPEELLLSYLFQKYDKDARGTQTTDMQTIVEVTFILSHIHDSKNKEITVSFSSLLILEWKDERLAWIPGQYKNVSKVVISKNRLWLPPIHFINNGIVKVSSRKSADDVNKVEVTYNGIVTWVVYNTLEMICETEYFWYPFDKQSCDIVIGGNLYDVHALNLSISPRGFLLAKNLSSPSWKIISKTFSKRASLNLNEELVQNQITYSLLMKRECTLFIIFYIIPSFIASFCITFTYFLSPGCIERVISCFISIAAYSLFTVLIALKIPALGDTIPILGIYLVLNFTLLLIATLTTTMCFRIYHLEGKAVMGKCLKKLLCIDCESKNLYAPSNTSHLTKSLARRSKTEEFIRDFEKITGAPHSPSLNNLKESNSCDYIKEINHQTNTNLHIEEKLRFIEKYMPEKIDNLKRNQKYWKKCSQTISNISFIFITVGMLVNISCFFVLPYVKS